jgi:hypothetical protein
MIRPLRELSRVGGALDALGRAAVPSTPPPRPSQAAPASDYMTGLVALAESYLTREEAMIERRRAMEWQAEAPGLGAVVGVLIGLSAGAYFARRGGGEK